jgi:AbrB family looped-hinge helix DNA binding protein
MNEKDNLVESAKITSKGQITIPKKIRELLDLNDGDYVVFYYDENKNVKIGNEKNIKIVLDDNTKQATIEREK